MRVDLRLEGIQLAFPLFFLLRDNVLHQLMDLGNGRLQCFSKVYHLKRTSYINIRIQISALPFFHGIIQLFQRLCDPCGNQLV